MCPDLPREPNQDLGADEPRRDAAERQRRVDTHFRTYAPFWKQVYEQPTLFGVVHQQRRALALAWIDELRLRAGSRVLELGCGAGVLAVDLARRGLIVDAVDVNPAMIELAQQEVESAHVADRVKLGIADAHDLPFSAASFDLVIALGVIPFLHTPARGLREIARVLAPQGRALFTNDNRYRLDHLVDPRLSPPFQPLRRAVRAALVRIGRRPAQKPPADLPVTFLTIGAVREMLAAAGLVEERCQSLGFGPFAVMGRVLLSEPMSIRLHGVLQAAADRDVPLLRSTGSQHLILAARSSAVAPAAGSF